MADTWKAKLTAIRPEPVYKKQVTAIDADLDSVAGECHDSVTGSQ
ncbi:MAG: hypothetical protein WB249_13985 [Candidatus Sulfotelmatobacter sp.]